MHSDLNMLPGGYVAVALSGEIDLATAPVLRDVLIQATSLAVTGVIVDLDGVTFVDAAGLGVLVGADKRAGHLPGGLRLVAVSARVRRLLALLGLDRHLAAFPAPPWNDGDRGRMPADKAAAGSPVAS